MEILDSCPYWPILVALVVPILGFGKSEYIGDKSNFGA